MGTCAPEIGLHWGDPRVPRGSGSLPRSAWLHVHQPRRLRRRRGAVDSRSLLLGMSPPQTCQSRSGLAQDSRPLPSVNPSGLGSGACEVLKEEPKAVGSQPTPSHHHAPRSPASSDSARPSRVASLDWQRCLGRSEESHREAASVVNAVDQTCSEFDEAPARRQDPSPTSAKPRTFPPRAVFAVPVEASLLVCRAFGHFWGCQRQVTAIPETVMCHGKPF